MYPYLVPCALNSELRNATPSTTLERPKEYIYRSRLSTFSPVPLRDIGTHNLYFVRPPISITIILLYQHHTTYWYQCRLVRAIIALISVNGMFGGTRRGFYVLSIQLFMNPWVLWFDCCCLSHVVILKYGLLVWSNLIDYHWIYYFIIHHYCTYITRSVCSNISWFSLCYVRWKLRKW